MAVVCAVVGLLAPVKLVLAQDSGKPVKNDGGAPEEEWSLALTPYAWFDAQSSDVRGTALRQSFNDLA